MARWSSIGWVGCMIVELGFFGYLFVAGAHGLSAAARVRSELLRVQERCAQLVAEVDALSEEITAWERDPAYRELYAREYLQYAAPHEVWYRL